MNQCVHIEHRKPQTGPLVIDHVPPLAADGMNATTKGGARIRVLCVDAPGEYPVVVVDSDGEVDSYKVGTPHITLDGQPTEPELVRVDSLNVGQFFFRGPYLWMQSERGRQVRIEDGSETYDAPSSMVHPLATGESIIITVTASEGNGSFLASTKAE